MHRLWPHDWQLLRWSKRSMHRLCACAFGAMVRGAADPALHLMLCCLCRLMPFLSRLSVVSACRPFSALTRPFVVLKGHRFVMIDGFAHRVALFDDPVSAMPDEGNSQSPGTDVVSASGIMVSIAWRCHPDFVPGTPLFFHEMDS